MKVGSLFAGIGGFDLGLERAGMIPTWQVEIDPYCNKVLEKHWPNVRRYRDVREVGAHNLESVDLICGGFPCPAFSSAGKKGGFKQDPLFYELIRICRELRPRWVLIENVEGFKKWREDSSSALEALGYEWEDAVLDSRDFGTPQGRRRYFAIGIQRGMLSSPQYLRWVQRKESEGIYDSLPNTENPERWWTPTIRTKEKWRAIFSHAKRCGDNNGIPNRMDRIKGLGNAVDPKIPEIIGRMIMEIESAEG